LNCYDVSLTDTTPPTIPRVDSALKVNLTSSDDKHSIEEHKYGRHDQ